MKFPKFILSLVVFAALSCSAFAVAPTIYTNRWFPIGDGLGTRNPMMWSNYNLSITSLATAVGSAAASSPAGELYFDGGGSVRVSGAAGNTIGTNNFTIAFKMRAENWAPSNSITFYRSHSTGNNRAELALTTAGTFQLIIVDNGGTSRTHTLVPDVTLVNGKAYQFVVTCNRGGNVGLYIDNSTGYTAAINANAVSVNIGSGNANGYQLGNGITASFGMFGVYLRDISQDSQTTDGQNRLFRDGDFAYPDAYSAVYSFDSDFSGGVNGFVAGLSSVLAAPITLGSTNNTLRVTSSGAGFADAQYSPTALIAGQTITLSYWVYIPSGNSTGVSIQPQDQGPSNVAFPRHQPTPDTWTQYTDVVKLPNTLSTINFFLTTSVGGTTVGTTDLYYLNGVSIRYKGVFFSLDCRSSNPAISTRVPDIAGSNDGTASSTTRITQVMPRKQINAGTVSATTNLASVTTTATLDVGTGKFVVSSTGNPTKVNNVTTSFPSSQGSLGSSLYNSDGAGTLTWVKHPISLFADFTTTGNATTVETVVKTVSIGASQLAVNNDTINFVAGGTFAATINNKQLKVYFGATLIFDSGAVAITAASSWSIHGTIMRTGAATQKCTTTLTTSSSVLMAFTSYSTATETLSGANTLKISALATANNDVVGEFWKGIYAPGP